MSPPHPGTARQMDRFPRASGDEPSDGGVEEERDDVFPARAGMSPSDGDDRRPGRRFPRASGDEPIATASFLRSSVFSPRERG